MIKKVPPVQADEDRITGLSIANFSLDLSDTELLKFVNEFVSEDIDDSAVTVVRERKKTVVNINNSLTKTTIRNAMSRISYSECKKKFYGRPLYCRPLRNITPEKKSPGCSPHKPASAFQNPEVSEQTSSKNKGRNNAFDIMMHAVKSSKRGSDELSSPSSPQNITEAKKSKSQSPQK